MERVFQNKVSRFFVYGLGLVLLVLFLTIQWFVEFDFKSTLVCFIVPLLVVVSHESLHYVAGYGYGCELIIKGIKLGITSPHMIPRNRYVLMALAPLVGLGVIAGLLMIPVCSRPYAFLALAINSAVSSSDIWVAIKALSFKRTAFVKDTMYGFDVYDSEET